MVEVPEQTKDMLEHAQIYQQQIQAVLAQKETLNLQLIEIKKTLEELAKTKESEVYKVVGPVLLKTKKVAVEKELGEKNQLINLRLKSLINEEEKIKAKIGELRSRLIRASKSSK